MSQLDDPADRSPGHAVCRGDLAEALTSITFTENSYAIDVDRPVSDLPAFDDQVLFEPSDRADDDHEGAAKRTIGVDVLAEADVLDVEVVQLIQHFREVSGS